MVASATGQAILVVVLGAAMILCAIVGLRHTESIARSIDIPGVRPSDPQDREGVLFLCLFGLLLLGAAFIVVGVVQLFR